MKLQRDNPCDRAIAYLKKSLPGDGPVVPIAEAVDVLTAGTLQADTRVCVSLPEGSDPVLKPFIEGVIITFLVDEGDHFLLIRECDLLESGWTMEDLLRRSIENLAKFIDEGRARLHDLEDGIFCISVDGNFEASLLLVDELWDSSLKGHAPNGFVVAIPSRGTLCFCDAASASSIEELRRRLEQLDHDRLDHALTTRLYRRCVETRTWVPYEN